MCISYILRDYFDFICEPHGHFLSGEIEVNSALCYIKKYEARANESKKNRKGTVIDVHTKDLERRAIFHNFIIMEVPM